jgi:hypothetical protein
MVSQKELWWLTLVLASLRFAADFPSSSVSEESDVVGEGEEEGEGEGEDDGRCRMWVGGARRLGVLRVPLTEGGATRRCHVCTLGRSFTVEWSLCVRWTAVKCWPLHTPCWVNQNGMLVTFCVEQALVMLRHGRTVDGRGNLKESQSQQLSHGRQVDDDGCFPLEFVADTVHMSKIDTQ